MYEVLRKFNFGENFIKWIETMYTDAMFKVKNNGWVSKTYPLERSLRQGCPMSAALFVIAIEILAIVIRNDEAIKGITIGNSEHKIIQYADDATICIRDLPSVKNVINAIEIFSKHAGPKLNMKKTKGIWLGNLKNHGLRLFENIKWTGKPVKCLGIYVGHNRDLCYEYNWLRRVDKIRKAIVFWNKRNMSIFGRVNIIKTYLLSKIVYPATVLPIPDEIIKETKTILFEYLWQGKWDRIKRSTVINDHVNGRLNMTEIDSFLMALKAAWYQS